MNYWLFKTEPSTYSFERLVKDGKTNWNGVRNFQARNHLRNAQVGDRALIYHSGDDKAVVGVAEVTRAGYPDIDAKTPGDWVQIDLKPVAALATPVALKDIKANKKLTGLALIKQSRLSCMPVSKVHFDTLLAMGTKAK